MPRAASFLPFLIVAASLSACFPEDANFKFGVSTSEVVGYVEPDSGEFKPEDVLIVVFQHHYLLETLETQERIYRVTADIRTVNHDGTFRVPMPSDVVTLELIVVAPDRLSTEFRFNRQVGIGQVSYHPVLLANPNWYSHYYTYIRPMLSNLIVESRYRLTNEDQQRVGDWLTAQSARMDALREAQAAVRNNLEEPPAPGEQEPEEYELAPGAPRRPQ